jgi:hypothetical protein
MTLIEFKAWFDGFTDGMEGAPSVARWEKIKAKIAKIDDKPTTYPVFIDRYVEPTWPRRYRDWCSTDTRYFSGDPVASHSSSYTSLKSVTGLGSGRDDTVDAKPFDARTAFFMAGKADGEAMRAA